MQFRRQTVVHAERSAAQRRQGGSDRRNVISVTINKDVYRIYVYAYALVLMSTMYTMYCCWKYCYLNVFIVEQFTVTVGRILRR